MQLKRFHDRRHDPLKVWKLSPIDLEALRRWDAYSAARNEMLHRTDMPHARWTVIRANDKRRGAAQRHPHRAGPAELCRQGQERDRHRSTPKITALECRETFLAHAESVDLD